MSICIKCGKLIADNAVKCPSCGIYIDNNIDNQLISNEQSNNNSNINSNISEYPFTPTLIFALLLGLYGAHRFYVGKIKSGVFMLFTLGGFSLMTLIDFIDIIRGVFTDK
ncbi:MAG: TM2 domain-containing protein, partial [Deltaproteobacteria bacterium]|nr:TM2 domain-containing protein [Deltaproteobacteria bacterium]